MQYALGLLVSHLPVRLGKHKVVHKTEVKVKVKVGLNGVQQFVTRLTTTGTYVP